MAMFPMLGFDWSVPNPFYVSSPVSSKPSKYLTELVALGFRSCGENCLKYVVYNGKSFKKNDAIGYRGTPILGNLHVFLCNWSISLVGKSQFFAVIPYSIYKWVKTMLTTRRGPIIP
jgi:hypothetical protein